TATGTDLRGVHPERKARGCKNRPHPRAGLSRALQKRLLASRVLPHFSRLAIEADMRHFSVRPVFQVRFLLMASIHFHQSLGRENA
ncbi:MAG: hypothetical protein OXD29_08925, partial [Roseovarius sp.]|nr:hypothetical protein [Roseovarius sp.]